MKSAAWCAMLCACGALTAASCRDADGASAAPPPRIEIKGAVAPIDSVTVCAPIEGRVVRIDAAEGAAVKPGDVLIVLTNPAVDRDLAYARAQIAAAELKMRGTAALPPSISAEGEKSAAAIMKAKEEKAARYRALLAAGDVSKQEVADAETEYAMARREWLAERERRAASAPVADPALARAELEELLRFVRAGATADVRVLTIPPHRFREPIARVIAAGGEGGPAIVVNVPNPDRMMQPGTPAVVTLQ